MDKKVLGLIAGSGKFPLLFAERAKSQGYSVVAAAIRGDTSFVLKFCVDKFAWFKVGELKKLFAFFAQQGVREVIMAGQVDPDNLFEKNVVFDKEFQKIFDVLRDRKADTIFSAIADTLQSQGIRLVDSTLLLKEYLAPKGTLTRRAPTERELDDIEFGRNIAKIMGGLDVGQTVVVKEKAILAIEAMEGTDRTITRGAGIARDGAVVVKMSKPNQDLRFDVPVVGPRTLQTMIRARARCLGIEAGKTLLIDRDRCVRLANKAGICIVAA